MRWSKEAEETAKNLLREGYSSREVGIKIGRSKAAVSYKNQKQWKIDMSHVSSIFLKKSLSLKGTGQGSKKIINVNAKILQKCSLCGKASKDVECNRCSRKKKKTDVQICNTCGKFLRKTRMTLDICQTCIGEVAREIKSVKRNKEKIRVVRKEEYKKQLEIKKERSIIARWGSDWYNGTITKLNYTDICSMLYDKDPCMLCGYEVLPVRDAHHVKERAKGGNDIFKNLLWICPNCHAGIHRKYVGILDLPDIWMSKKELITKLLNLNPVYYARIKSRAVNHYKKLKCK
jgi:hypothetical protein